MSGFFVAGTQHLLHETQHFTSNSTTFAPQHKKKSRMAKNGTKIFCRLPTFNLLLVAS
jgi:hypothetical protein